MKKLLQFSADYQFSIKVCLYRWNTFWQLCRKIWAKHGRNSFSNIEFAETIWHCWKKVSNCALQLENAVRTQVVCSQNNFLYKSLKIWKTIFFDKFVSRQTDPSKLACSFDKIAQNFTPKLQQFLAQIS